jgi:site-specific DNA recombinase
MTRPRTTTAPVTRKIRCAIYTRKSSEEGLEQEFNSLDAQRESAEAYIASQKGDGWVALPDRYDDGGFTGGNMDRPALARLLVDISAGKVDCVVVYKVDRLSRSLLDFAKIMATLDEHKASFVSVTQHFNTTTSMGRLTLNVLLSFAQFEREIIGERIRDKKAATARKGKWSGGTPVLGYDVDRSGPSPRLVVNAEEAVRVRKIFDLYLQHGSLLPVVKDLAKRGWTTKQWRTKAGAERHGAPFNKTNLHHLLTNPVYAGKIRYKTDIYDGEHEALVPPGKFSKVVEQLHQNGRNGGVDVRNTHGALLKSLVHCKACGRAMVHTFTSRGAKRYRYYTCTNVIKRGRDSCPGRSLPAGEIERVVVDQVLGIAKDAELRAEVLELARKQMDAEAEGLRTEQTELQRELARFHSEIRILATQSPATSAATAKIAELHERVQRGESRMAELQQQAADLERDRVDDEELAAAFTDFDGMWAALSPQEQARILRLLVARVDYDSDEGSVSVTFHLSGIKALAEGEAMEEAA